MKPPTEKGDPYIVPAIQRATLILELLAKDGPGRGVTEISNLLDIPKSSAFSILYTLLDGGFVERDAISSRYRLGPKTFELGNAYIRGTNFVQEFRPIAREIVAQCNETVHLTVLDGTEVIYLARQEGNEAVRVAVSMGARLPAHAVATGKVLLASLPEAELKERLRGVPLVGRTPRTITFLDTLLEELQQVRALGYAIDNEESAKGVLCIASPVINHEGRTTAAMSVSFPLIRGSKERVEAIINLIKDGATKLSHRLGYFEGATHLHSNRNDVF